MLPCVTRQASPRLPTKWGVFTAHGYTGDGMDAPYVALAMGAVTTDAPVLARVHSACATGDIFASLKCDCGDQLDLALQRIEAAGTGVLIYASDHEGRGIGLIDKLRGYELQSQGLDTVEANLHLGHAADRRDYGFAAAIFSDLGATKLRLMTNNPAKIAGLEKYGIEICERVPLVVAPGADNLHYLATKRDRAGHILPGAA